MEHPSTVVLHLGGDKIKVSGLVIGNANIELVIFASLGGFSCWPVNLWIKTKPR